MDALKNRIIISTRPAGRSENLRTLVEAKGGTLIDIPLITITHKEPNVHDKEVLKHISEYSWIVFTSTNGVRAFFSGIRDLQIPRLDLNRIKFAAVGRTTATAIEKEGYECRLQSQAATGRRFAAELAEHTQSDDHILLIQGSLASVRLYDVLAKHSQVERLVLYQTQPLLNPSPELLRQIEQNFYDLILVTSPSGFQGLLNQPDIHKHIDNLKLAAIGSTTARAISEAGIEPVLVCSAPYPEVIVNDMEEYFRKSPKKTKA